MNTLDEQELIRQSRRVPGEGPRGVSMHDYRDPRDLPPATGTSVERRTLLSRLLRAVGVR